MLARSPILVLLVAALLAGPSTAQFITTTHGHRHLHTGWTPPPIDLDEGAVTTTFSGTVPMDTAFAQPGLVRIGPNTWQYDFPWSATDSLTFHFVDRQGHPMDARTRPSWTPTSPGGAGLPVLALDVAPDSLWSPQLGIYVWGTGAEPNWDQRGAAWERDAVLRWYDSDGSLRHQRPVGLRINGNWNRQWPQKSLRLYFDHHGDPDTLEDDIFGSPPHTHQRLILRAGYERPTNFLRDPLATEVMAAAGHERSRWAPVQVDLAGEPWGLYHLRDRPDDEWAELTLGLDGDYDMIKDGEVVHGDLAAWSGFLNDVAAHPTPEANDFFTTLSTQLDLVSYLDWALLQIWSATSDNGGQSNVITVRPDGGPWRFIAYDQDGSFGTSNRHHDFFRFFAAADQSEFDARKPPTYYPLYTTHCRAFFDLWRQVMSNPRGRRLLRERWQTLADGPMSFSWCRTRLDAMVAVQADAAVSHGQRWGWSNTLPMAAATIRSVIAARTPLVTSQLDASMDDWMDAVELDGFEVDGPATAVRIRWHTAREIDCEAWRVERRTGPDAPWTEVTSVDATGTPDQGADYAIVDDTPGHPDGHQYRLVHRITGGAEVAHPWVETWQPAPAPPTVVINEFLASNDAVNADETGAYEDWTELYNAGDTAVCLDGYHLTDDPAAPLQWSLPPGLVLQPGQFLLIWCDDDPEDGLLHASFKLSADGESVGLYHLVDGEPELIDARDFGPQVTDVSEGRLTDGAATWTTFDPPTPGATNQDPLVVDPVGPHLALTAWPNPFNPSCQLSFWLPAAGFTTLSVHDLAGRRVSQLVAGKLAAGRHTVTFHGRGPRGERLPSGVYLAALEAEGTRQVTRVLLLK